MRNITQDTAHVFGTTQNGVPHFDTYACPGDTVTINEGLYTYTATLNYDADITPDECYTPEARSAWYKNEWWFGYIIITAHYNGVELPDPCLASLSGLEVNFPDGGGNKYLSSVVVVDELLPEARIQAGECLQQLRAKLSIN